MLLWILPIAIYLGYLDIMAEEAAQWHLLYEKMASGFTSPSADT